MIGGQQERIRQEQMRENLEQLVVIKKELQNFPHLEVIEKVGQGSFGDIYKAWDSKRARWVAMKFEKREQKNKYSLIKKEAQIMQQVKGSKYFAILFDSRFAEQYNYNFIEMSFLGPNLENLKKRLNGKFSLRTVLLIANQMISSLQILHEKGVIHRDIKPENFVIGSDGQHHQVYIIDFGLSKYYIDENKVHIEQKANKGLVGTARYTSINSHLGFEQSRRDDMQSLAYLLLYFAKGSLIWQNLQFKDKEERFKKITELKQTSPHEQMCRGLPKQFHEFLNHVKSLSFEQVPDYDHYRALFSQCYSQNYTTPQNQSCYDWCPKNCALQYKAVNKQVASIKNIQDNNSNPPLINTPKNTVNMTNSNVKSNQKLQQQSFIDSKQNISVQNVIEKKQSTNTINDTQIQPNNIQGVNSISVMPNGVFNTNLLIPAKTQKQSDHDLLAILDKQVSQDVYKKQLENYEINEEDNTDEGHISEFKLGERKHVPLFRTENNFQKHQQHTFSQLNLIQSINHHFEDKVMTSNNLEGGNNNNNIKTPYLKKTHSLEGKLGIENGSGRLLNSNLLNTNVQLSTPYHLQVQPFSNSNIINKDSSQYPNNWSNEWNSEQDEKVLVQQVMPFNPSNNQQCF